MKLIITEEQYRILNLYEQFESKFDRIGIALTSKNDEEFSQRMKDYDKFTRRTANLTLEEFIDNFVDIVSAVLEVIPGIGNLGSAVADIAHSLSFFLRAYLSTDNIKKIEYIFNGLSTGVMATIPFAGNLASIGFRGTIKKFLNMTHSDVTMWLKQNGINIKSGVFLRNKNRFTPHILAALISYFKGEATEFETLEKVGDFLTNISKKLSEILNKINEFKHLTFFNKIIESLQYVKNLIDEMKQVLK